MISIASSPGLFDPSFAVKSVAHCNIAVPLYVLVFLSMFMLRI
jgi:hypothetical protein